MILCPKFDRDISNITLFIQPPSLKPNCTLQFGEDLPSVYNTGICIIKDQEKVCLFCLVFVFDNFKLNVKAHKYLFIFFLTAAKAL